MLLCMCALHEVLYIRMYDSLTIVGKGGVVDMMIDEGAGR